MQNLCGIQCFRVLGYVLAGVQKNIRSYVPLQKNHMRTDIRVEGTSSYCYQMYNNSKFALLLPHREITGLQIIISHISDQRCCGSCSMSCIYLFVFWKVFKFLQKFLIPTKTEILISNSWNKANYWKTGNWLQLIAEFFLTFILKTFKN